MRLATLLAFSLVFAWSQDGARAQSSVKPPVSIAPPGTSPAPNPAADYDGFSVGAGDDNDTPARVMPPARPRATKGPKSNPDTAPQSAVDPEDEALRRKLTICKDCK